MTKIKNKKSYWENFYKKNHILEESSFANFVLKKIKKKTLLDIGCGNGRDTFFFLKKGIKAFGIDFSKTVIKKNNLFIKNKFILANFCSDNLKIRSKKFDYIYARFFLHAINYNEENRFLKNIKKISKKNSKIFLEFRTTKDKLMRSGKAISKYERFHDHYRRFIKVENFKKKLILMGYKLIYISESINFAKFKTEKPSICRLVLKK